jgi:sugar-specific transcriptional regulator TrmB
MIEELKAVGLGHYESKVMEVLMNEKLNLRELSKKSGVPFGKIYSIVKNLKSKRLVKETNSRPKLVYIENASQMISKLLKEKEDNERLIMENLHSLATEIDKSKNKPQRFFQIGTTVQDNKKIQARSFTEAENEVLQILNIHHKPESNRESKTVWEKEIANAVKRGVIFRSVYPRGTRLPKILQYLNKRYPTKFHVGRLDTDFTRCDIIDEKKVLIKMVSPDAVNFGGVIFVENEDLAQNLKKIFEEIWEQAD